MKVIYAGYPKTGTKTMKAALTILGYNCYDFDENFYFNGDKWYKIMKEGGDNLEDFRKMFKHCDATTDTPITFYWDDVFKAYPNAKVIICIRDEESWIRSWKNQLRNLVQNNHMKILSMLSPTAQKFFRYNRMITRTLYNGHESILPWRMYTGVNPFVTLKHYRMHNLYVLQTVPKEQLLVLKLGHGWEPICKFLGKPIPDVPYPHENKNASVLNDLLELSPPFRKMQNEAKITLAILLCIVSIFVYYFFGI